RPAPCVPPIHKIYPLSLHDALPILHLQIPQRRTRLARLPLRQQKNTRKTFLAHLGLVGAKQTVRLQPRLRTRRRRGTIPRRHARSEEHTSELQSRENLVYRLMLEKQ